jgi:transposase-like protein
MKEESLLQAGAQRYERTDSHRASRNGYKPRTLLTKYGELKLLNLNSVNFSLKLRYLRIIPELKRPF